MQPEEAAESTREVDLAWLKELPNGGGRAAQRRSSEPVTGERDIVNEPQDSEEVVPAEDATPTEDVVLVTGMNAQDEPENIDWLPTACAHDLILPEAAAHRLSPAWSRSVPRCLCWRPHTPARINKRCRGE